MLESAQRNNSLRSISGFLLYNGRNFLQLIEGAEADLRSLMSTLSRDLRHSGMSVLIDEPIDERSCPRWSMHRIRLSDTVELRRLGLVEEIPGPISAHARKLVENFAVLN
ncbi:MAG: BLUF domain-containing protein [Tsuneonella sp.]